MLRAIAQEVEMSDAETLDLVRLKELRRRFETAAAEAATLAVEADRLAGGLRNRAQWLALQEQERR
jgi:hypothetical protein